MPKKPITDLNKFRDQFVRWTLRRASFRWPPRGEALKAARFDRGLYRCAVCAKVYATKEVRIDHVHPVVPVPQIVYDMRGAIVSASAGDVSLGQYVLRLFTEAGGLQVLCQSCHKLKTDGENNVRKEYRRWLKGRNKI
jgi:hypothetical protein